MEHRRSPRSAEATAKSLTAMETGRNHRSRFGYRPAPPIPAVLDPWDEIKIELSWRWPVRRWGGVGVVVGCSGGADSVALLRALAELRQPGRNGSGGEPCPVGGDSPPLGFLLAAHFHHRMRGAAADLDQSFTAELAGQLGVRIVVGRGRGKGTDEASMRRQRLAFLRQVAERFGARYVALAHSADDNVETLLHHLFRGTGPMGLCGIPRFRELGPELVLARPLLSVRRESIRRALRRIAQDWREDTSNQDPSYRRNWIRTQLIPELESQYPRASESMIRTIESQGGWREFIDEQAMRWLDTAISLPRVRANGGDPVKGETQASLRRNANGGDPVHEAVVIRGLQRLWDRHVWPRGKMTASHWKRLAGTIASDQPQRYTLPGDLQVTASGDCVTIRPGR